MTSYDRCTNGLSWFSLNCFHDSKIGGVEEDKLGVEVVETSQFGEMEMGLGQSPNLAQWVGTAQIHSISFPANFLKEWLFGKSMDPDFINNQTSI